MIISAWWLQTRKKFSEEKLEEIHIERLLVETLKQVQIPPKHEVVIAVGKCAFEDVWWQKNE